MSFSHTNMVRNYLEKMLLGSIVSESVLKTTRESLALS